MSWFWQYRGTCNDIFLNSIFGTFDAAGISRKGVVSQYEHLHAFGVFEADFGHMCSDFVGATQTELQKLLATERERAESLEKQLHDAQGSHHDETLRTAKLEKELAEVQESA